MESLPAVAILRPDRGLPVAKSNRMPDRRVAVPLGSADPPSEVPERVRYPETDGQPMPDGPRQRRVMNGVLHAVPHAGGAGVLPLRFGGGAGGSGDVGLSAGRADYKPMLPAGMVGGEEEYASGVLDLGFRRDGSRVRVRDLNTRLEYSWPEEDREGHRRETRRLAIAEAGQAIAEAGDALLLERKAEFEAKLGVKPEP